MGSLLGSKGTKQSATNQSQSTSTQQSSSFDRTTPGFVDELTNLFNSTMSGQGPYSKQNALEDVQGTLQFQALQALQSQMPSIARQEQGAGAYNSTTKSLLQNDAQARITQALAQTQLQAITDYAGIENKFLNSTADIAKALTSRESGSQSTGESQSTATGYSSGKGGGSGLLGLFADGGVVPDGDADDSPATQAFNQFSAIRNSLNDKVISDLLATALPSSDTKLLQSAGVLNKDAESFENQAESFLLDSALSWMGFQNGGKVPIRSGESDVQTGGKIKGPQSKTGEDNQVIGVAGGEGIIAKDVMDVPGVPELVRYLNEKFHTPIK